MWIPETENQIKKSGRQQREKSGIKKKKNGEVFPGDVNILKAREVGKLSRDVNEKSQVGVTALSNKGDGKVRKLSHEKLRVECQDDDATTKEIALSKISFYQSKICQYLDYLREIVEEPPELEDKNDLKKRRLRATEFSNRFARNHLYQIGRIVSRTKRYANIRLSIFSHLCIVS